MKNFSIKSKLLLTFAFFLIIITLLNAWLTAFLMNRQHEVEAFAHLSRQLLLFQSDLNDLREEMVTVALKTAIDEKNLSDLALLFNQTLKSKEKPGTSLEFALSLNKVTSLNRLQLILRSTNFSSIAVYLKDSLSHYITQDETGIIAWQGGVRKVIGNRQKEGGKVRLDNWRFWTETPLPPMITDPVSISDRLRTTFDFLSDQMVVLNIIVPIQAVTRPSFNETIAESLSIVDPETLSKVDEGGKAPTIVGMFVFTKIFDMTFLNHVAAKTGVWPTMISPDGKSRLQYKNINSSSEDLPDIQSDAFIQSQTITHRVADNYQAFILWKVDGEPTLILNLTLPRAATISAIKQTVTGVAVVAGLILILGSLIGYFLITRLISPITSLTNAVSAMGFDDSNLEVGIEKEHPSHVKLGNYLCHPIVPKTDDEIGELTHAFNTLTTQLYQSFDSLEARIRKRTNELSIAKEQAENAQFEAEKANQAKNTFLAQMSHELRTPLNAVLGFSQLMQNDPHATADQKEHLNIINRSGEHLLNLINNVLDISKIEAGRVELDESPLDLYQFSQELVLLMSAHAREKGLDFNLEQSPDLPRHITVDGGKLRQILINLIGNAIKYTAQGSVTVKIDFSPLSREHRREESVPRTLSQFTLRLAIEDTGPGIRAEDRERIFTSFMQLENCPSTEAGTGLGLALCKQYTDLMNGTIRVTGEPGKGSVFYVEIPVTELPSEEIPVEMRLGRVIGLAQGQPRHRLLIAEDHLENRLLLHKLLHPLGFDLREAFNGQEAVAIFEQWHPHLIWMDILMPVMDGLAATRYIKATDEGAQTKVIAITAHALEEEKELILAAGCDDFVRKPYREQEIFEVMRKHLGLRYMYEEEKVEEVTIEKGVELSTGQLAGLPEDLLNRLQQAVVEVDQPCAIALIDQITHHDATIGKALLALAQKLDYGRMLFLLKNRKLTTG